MDISKAIKQCEDHLFPAKALSVQERVIYYHLLRHTRAEGKDEALFALLPLAKALSVSESTARECIRSLNEKGCIRIVERSRFGHLVRVNLPEELPGIIPEPSAELAVDIEGLDFYSGRRFAKAIFEREAGRCFYCLRSIRLDTFELDHVKALANQTNNSYRNIVASCHECNTGKLEFPAEDFLRSLYRKALLSQTELAERLSALEKLAAGEFKPRIEALRAAI